MAGMPVMATRASGERSRLDSASSPPSTPGCVAWLKSKNLAWDSRRQNRLLGFCFWRFVAVRRGSAQVRYAWCRTGDVVARVPDAEHSSPVSDRVQPCRLRMACVQQSSREPHHGGDVRRPGDGRPQLEEPRRLDRLPRSLRHDLSNPSAHWARLAHEVSSRRPSR